MGQYSDRDEEERDVLGIAVIFEYFMGKKGTRRDIERD